MCRRYGCVFTSSGIYEGHKFKILSIVNSFGLSFASGLYLRMNGIFGGQNLSQPVMEEILLGFQTVSR